MKKHKGTHRVKSEGAGADGVWVTDGGMGFEIPEVRYVGENYEPPIATLPWGKSTPDGK